MDIAAIKARIKASAKVDIDAVWARYEALAPEPNADGFLRYLRDQRVIDTRLFTELHTAGEIDATQVNPESVGYRATVAAATGPDTVGTQLVEGEVAAPGENGSGNSPSEQPGGRPEVYEILGALGKGAMGEVHLARDYVLRRKVALKSILPAMQQNQALFQRFLGEMQITAQLDHPFIVPVYGIENGPGGGLAYAMKLVQGREFGDLLEETRQLLVAGKPLDAHHSLEGRLEAFLKVCDAMAFAHERGVVHRDLKPANIMIGRFNEVYVMDWGIARLMGKAHKGQDEGVELYDASGSDASQATRTRIGSTIGTPIYMSPEQAAGRNEELDGRSDQYSLGLILQEIVTLTGAVGGTTLQEVLTNAKDARRVPPRPPVPGLVIPRELGAITDKATRLKPEERYESVTTFADDIRRYLRNDEIAAEPDTTVQGAARWVSKHRMKAVAMILAVMVLGAGATIGMLVYNQTMMARKHTRELRLAELHSSSSMHAQELDSSLHFHEGQLTRMAGAVGMALGTPSRERFPLHFAADFKPGPDAMPGLIESAVYDSFVSFDSPVASLAPGSDKEQLEAQLGGIDGLRTMAKSVMLESADPNFHTMSEAERQQALAKTGVPISRISLTLENGLHLEYPGNSKLAPDYDGRQEASYKAAAKSFAVVWGANRSGSNGSVVLPCSAPLRDSEGKLFGVLTFEVTPKRAIAASLETGGAAHVESSLLVDKSGTVLAQNNLKDTKPEGATLDLPSVREAMGRGERGYLQTERNGHQVIVTYQPLSTVGWYVVTIANMEALERSVTPDGDRAGSVTATPTATAKPSPPSKPAALPPPAQPEPEPEPSASASAAPSAQPPALFGKLEDLKTAKPVPPPPPPSANPFDPWKAYDKGQKK